MDTSMIQGEKNADSTSFSALTLGMAPPLGKPGQCFIRGPDV
jgi:hypothetical protein